MRTALNLRSHRVRKSFESLNREIPGAGPQGDSIVGKITGTIGLLASGMFFSGTT